MWGSRVYLAQSPLAVYLVKDVGVGILGEVEAEAQRILAVRHLRGAAGNCQGKQGGQVKTGAAAGGSLPEAGRAGAGREGSAGDQRKPPAAQGL